MRDHTNMTALFEIPSSVASVLDRALEANPDHEALVTRRVRWSYRELDTAIARAARALAEFGVRPGDRVAACLPNEADIVVAFHAAMRLGAIWVGINQALAPPEKTYLLADSGASLLLCDAGTAEAMSNRRAELAALRAVVVEEDWRSAHSSASPLNDLETIEPHRGAALAYTSGTTGRPKGVVLSQHNLVVPGAALVRSRRWGPDLRKGDCLPLTIVNMLVLTTVLTPQAGGTCVVMDQTYAQGVAEWIERERVTVWNGPPAILHSLVSNIEITPGALASLREVWSGGSELPEVLRSRFAEKFQRPVIGTYGLSEAPTVVSIDPPDGVFMSGASGRVLPHLKVTTRDEQGEATTQHEAAELCLAPVDSGPWAGVYRPPLGYWNRPVDTEAMLAGGVVHTGDVGTVDPEGWLSVRDRKNLVINRGGANVYPAEIERVLHAAPGVAGAAAGSIPDERLGERVVAAVELTAEAGVSSEELIERCRAELARYKVPERIHIVDELPRNSMGKVDRSSLASVFNDPTETAGSTGDQPHQFVDCLDKGPRDRRS